MVMSVVVIRLPRPMEGNGVTPIFISLQNCQFHHRRLVSLEHFNVFYIYHTEHYGLSFLDLTDVIVLQGLLCLYTFQFLQVHFACVLCI